MTPLAQRTNTVFTKIINHKMQIATYLTGKFPVNSNMGNYLFVLSEYDSNIILIRPMKSRSGSKFIWLLKNLHEHLITRGINPAYARLDNETTPAFQRELKSKDITFQLEPPLMHLYNAAERLIIKFKYHFVAGIFSTDPDSLMQNWYWILE